MEILIDKENVKKTGKNILSYSEEFSTCIKRFESIIDSINTVWSGADALKYINVMKEKYAFSLEELNDVIKQYGMYLEKVPVAYDTLDEVFSSKNIDV